MKIIAYRQIMGILPLLWGVDQVLIPAPESRPTLPFLNNPSLCLFSELYFVHFQRGRFNSAQGVCGVFSERNSYDILSLRI
jgi:hypothetical protein